MSIDIDTPKSSKFRDFLNFRTMLTPVIIRVLFLLGIIGCIISGAFFISQGVGRPYGDERVFMGIAIILLGPIGVRLLCEVMILFFRMNETITEIKNKIGN